MSEIGVDKAPAPEGTPNSAGIEAKDSRHILCDMATEGNAGHADCSRAKPAGGFEIVS